MKYLWILFILFVACNRNNFSISQYHIVPVGYNEPCTGKAYVKSSSCYIWGLGDMPDRTSLYSETTWIKINNTNDRAKIDSVKREHIEKILIEIGKYARFHNLDSTDIIYWDGINSMAKQFDETKWAR